MNATIIAVTGKITWSVNKHNRNVYAERSYRKEEKVGQRIYLDTNEVYCVLTINEFNKLQKAKI
jgi:hypothetical protein